MFDAAPTLPVHAPSAPAVPGAGEAAADAIAVAARAGAPAVVLVGGEAPDWAARAAALARRARALGLAVGVETDGRHLDEAAAAALAAAGVARVWVAVPTFVKARHDAIVGREGAGAEALAALAALGAAGVPTWVDVLASEETLRTFAGTLRTVFDRFAWVEGLRVIGAGPHPPSGPGPLPDLAALGPLLRRARTEAEAHGLRVEVRPGSLPACVGWAPGVRAAPAPSGVPGVYGAPCRECALRPACSGAWPAVWDAHGGQGVGAPERLVEPWDTNGAPGSLQTIVRLGAHGLPEARRALEAAATPTRWLWTPHLDEAMLALPFTHLAVEQPGLAVSVSVLRLARRVGRPVHVGLRLPPEPVDLRPVVHLCELAGVATVALLAGEGWVAAELELREVAPGLDVRRVAPAAGAPG